MAGRAMLPVEKPVIPLSTADSSAPVFPKENCMEFIDTSGPLPVKSWAPQIDEGSWQQVRTLARHPCIRHHIALMPDCHQGYGMPIGGVIAVKDAVIPNAVGVDIGCGMCAMQTDIDARGLERATIADILHTIRKEVPAGFAHRFRALSWEGFSRAPSLPTIQKELSSAARQLGTLGGGNHFIELQEDEHHRLWCMLHCGSRNFGYKIARAYHTIAQRLCEKHHYTLPCAQLAYLPLSCEEAHDYELAMDFVCAFARENRRIIMQTCRDVITTRCHAEIVDTINIHHNFAAREHHFDEEYMIHRKGATRARAGQPGIVPGSMGTSSYIVRGKGNPESYMSCAHGAGRLMSRKAANTRFRLEDVRKAMAGIVWDAAPAGKKRKKIDLSEAPHAYKNIDSVIALQTDLIEITHRLSPLGVMKG